MIKCECYYDSDRSYQTMHMSHKRNFLVAIISTLMFGCHKKESGPSQQLLDSAMGQFRKDTFYRDIPKSRTGDFGPEYLTIKRTEKIVDIRPIEYGVDSIEFRIWYGYQVDTIQMLSIRNANCKWRGEVYKFSAMKNDRYDTNFKINKQVVEKTPVSGWNSLLSQLIRLGIFTLPDDNNIFGYPYSTGGNQVIVEIAGSRFYRIYSYLGPSYLKDSIKEANQMAKILELIEKELDFRTLHKI